MEVSRRTSGEPLLTRWPSLNMMALTRPATSGRITTDSSERRLPTAVIVWGMEASVTLVASTVIACGAPGPAPLPFSLPAAADAPVGPLPAAGSRCVPAQ